jgi:DNA-directed RNA polymerase
VIEPVDHPLWQTQLDLEARMVSDGAEAFQAALVEAQAAGRGADVGFARTVVQATVEPVAAALTAWVEGIEAMGRGRRPQAYPFLKEMDPHLAAFVTIKTMINFLARSKGAQPAAQGVASYISSALMAEHMVEAFKVAYPRLVAAIVESLDKTTSHQRHRRRVLVSAMHREGFSPPEWSHDIKAFVGLRMLELAVSETNLFETFRAAKMLRVQLSQEAIKLIEDRNKSVELLQPRLGPCVVPPKPWDASCRAGGYWTAVTPNPLPLVKSPGRRLGAAGPARSSETVIRSTNAIQDTPWCVNQRVLAVMKEFVDRGLEDHDVLPPIREREVPPKPHDIATNEEARKEWRSRAAQAYAYNSTLRSRRVQVIKTLTVAEEFAAFERIYFPHQLDFRGRAYALPQWLNPQGPDYAKGLLMFADGKPVGDEQGPGWLAIHGANCYGVDKVGLEERIQWIEDHEIHILVSASDPLSELWWTEADQPWQFLAFCFEWSSYRQYCASNRGPEFVSRLPVMVDGTCNGLQHYSAILRDPIGGAATNLVPSDKPQDIYGVVAGKVMEQLRDRLGKRIPTTGLTTEDDLKYGFQWLAFGIDRKITKRPVMVLPYGGTHVSCREYVEDAVRERGLPHFETEDDARKAIQYLSKIVWQSIGDVVVAAKAGMAWLQKATRVASGAGISSLSWVTPSGFEAQQFYVAPTAKVIKTTFLGCLVKLIIEKPTKKPDKRKQASAIAPNFVHSLDAAAMQLTIEMAMDNGVTSFAMIHDSYGTLAADMPMLSACLRRAFVGMYQEHDVLAELRDRLLAVLPDKDKDKLPELPAKGSLEIEEVLRSDFFFA